jgi:starch synthase (maltosyl-transferring)
MKPTLANLEAGRSRVQIEGVAPQVDQGRFAAKRVVGDSVEVRARVFADGHDMLGGRVLFRHQSEQDWNEVELTPLVNDWWQGAFPVRKLGRYLFTIEAWIDRFATWRRDLHKRVAAGQDVAVDLLAGAQIVREHLPVATPDERPALESFARQLVQPENQPRERARRGEIAL